MRRQLILILLLIVGNISCVFAKFPMNKADIYVSPNGSDNWSGTLCEPNAKRTDGPFATFERARDEVRKLKKIKSKDILVLFRGGTYQLKKTVVFGLEDSGDDSSVITYAAYPGENPVFSSGKEIKGWKKVEGTLPGLPEEAQGKILVANVSGHFRTLFDSEGMLSRAQSSGFIPLKGGSRTQIHCPKGLLKNWDNVEDAEIVVRPLQAWIMNILPLSSVDVKTQVATTAIKATYAMNPLHFLPKTKSCWLENVIDELDKPGEWVLNTKQGKVYLWPRNNSTVFAPTLNELIRVEGNIDFDGPKDVPVKNICFRGLTFTQGERYILNKNDKGLQHDWDMLDKDNALVRFRGTENCAIEQCHFINSGSGAIRVDLYGQNNKISENKIEHMGGGGILLCGYGAGTKDVNKNNVIYNNDIHDVGEIYWQSPGIFIWQSGENIVKNNLIHDTPYTGIILSGTMTEFFSRKGGRELVPTIRWNEIGKLPVSPKLEDVRKYLHTNNNKIEYNEIHNVMKKMGDGNAIYIRGAGANNIISHNYVHDLVTPMIMQCAIRTDGGQKDTYITENVIYRCTSQGIMLKLNNHCENNIVVDIIEPPRGYYLSLREGPMTGATIKRNIFYSTKNVVEFINELKPGTKSSTEDGRGRPIARSLEADTDYNIYYCKANNTLAKKFLENQQKDNVDVHSQAVDPMFVDPEHGDFRFKPGSPALKMGIVPIDLSIVGLQKRED